MIDLLPLERNSVLTEILKELAMSGSSFIVSDCLTVDRVASVYSLMSYIYAKFGEVDVPFYLVYEKIGDYVQGYVEYYEKIRNEIRRTK